MAWTAKHRYARISERKARLVVEPDGTVSVYNGYTEMGQGLLTVIVQFASEVTGLPASCFRPKVDSTYQLACGQTTGSRATLFAGRAVVSAAEKLRAVTTSKPASRERRFQGLIALVAKRICIHTWRAVTWCHSLV